MSLIIWEAQEQPVKDLKVVKQMALSGHLAGVAAHLKQVKPKTSQLITQAEAETDFLLILVGLLHFTPEAAVVGKTETLLLLEMEEAAVAETVVRGLLMMLKQASRTPAAGAGALEIKRMEQTEAPASSSSATRFKE